jgi:hypothetical protein
MSKKVRLALLMTLTLDPDTHEADGDVVRKAVLDQLDNVLIVTEGEQGDGVYRLTCVGALVSGPWFTSEDKSVPEGDQG